MTFNAEELESIYERVSIGELFSLESCMDKKDIHQLLEYFANRGIFHQFMACYIRYANHELILNDLLKNASDDLLASIATDRLTPISTLKLLENERSETVRSHAKLNLLRNALGEGV